MEFYRRTASSLTTAEHAAALAAARAIGDQLQTNWEQHRARFVSTDEAIDAAAAAAIAAQDGTAEPFTRTQVHVAAGMLAVQLNVAPDEALDRLRAHSYASGRRISAVAADIIAHRLTVHDESGPPRP